MALIGITGSPTDVNTKLMFRALEREPILVIDCANCACTQEPYSFVTTESARTRVVGVEALTMLRDAIAHAPRMARRIGTRTIIITTFNHFLQHDTIHLYEHAWIMLSRLAIHHTVIVGVHEDQKALAARYCHNLLRVHA